MQWRNEQLYHLRQQQQLTETDQEWYFTQVVTQLFEQERPGQILFSYLENDTCIGYGGLVHINWADRHAEISFVMETAREQQEFAFHWKTFLALLEPIAFDELQLNKIFTYAYDLRPHLFGAIEEAGYKHEATLKGHCLFDGNYIDVLIHGKWNPLQLRKAGPDDARLLFDWANDPEVRQNSVNQQKITWEEHVSWLERKFAGGQSRFFMLEYESRPAGQIRLDREGDQWVINYTIAAEFRGKGLGKRMVELVLLQFPDATFRAVVKKDNVPSLRIFEALGFRQTDETNDLFTFIR
jgi:RimJ/RimL family protein N-acetyltransferase